MVLVHAILLLAPSPPAPPPFPTQMRMMATMLMTMTMMCFLHAGIPGLRYHMLVASSYVQSFFGMMFCRSLYRPLSKVNPSMCFNDTHPGLLSKGLEERADGDHDHHLGGGGARRGKPREPQGGRAGRGKSTPQGTTTRAGIPWYGEGEGERCAFLSCCVRSP